MYQNLIVAWMIGHGDPIEDRERAHRIALAEARTADAASRTRVAPTPLTRTPAPQVPRVVVLHPADGPSLGRAVVGTDIAACCA